MTIEESSSAIEGDISFLLEREYTIGTEFFESQDSQGSNFLHLLMKSMTERHDLSSFDYCLKLFEFIIAALGVFPKLVCQKDQIGNTPIHVLAPNDILCDALAGQTLSESTSLLSKLLSACANAITEIESRRTTANEFDNYELPWVMQNSDGNTPLHIAIMANNKVLVLELLSYSKEPAWIVNNHNETPLHLLIAARIGMEEVMAVEILKLLKANSKALGMQDKDGLTPISRAIEAKNLNVVVTLLRNFPEFSNTDGQTLWNIFLQNQSNSFLDQLLQNEAFRKMLGQRDKDGNTPLHIAIQDQCFGFLHNLLCTERFEHDFANSLWLMGLLSIPNNVGQAPEDLLADLRVISVKLEKTLLTDRRMKGIRSSWGVGRSHFQHYMSSMNVIAALQATITFTAAFTVPGGLNQDTGIPILIGSRPFQAFMIADVIAMCLSMMVLVCLIWMMTIDKRRLVIIQDFALTLLLLSFAATLLTFMIGVYASIYLAKPWIAQTTLVLCSLLVFFLPRRTFFLTLMLLKRLIRKEGVLAVC